MATTKSATVVATKALSFPPNQTLYITNLASSKIAKQDLRLCLYTLFATYGPILDVIALKTMKMRGQAHVVFRDVHTATQAMRALQGFEFLGMEIIQYAKTKSDTIAKLDGTLKHPTAAIGEVTATELQQSIFNAPPASSTKNLGPPPILKPPPLAGADHVMEDARSPAVSVAGQKRRRDDDDDEDEEGDKGKENEEDSEGDAAMEEDSDED